MSRPIGVTLLALLAGLAGLMAAVHTMQYLHLIPFVFGPIQFFGFDLLGGILWGITTAIWAWATANLWLMRAQALQFVIVLAGLNLILAALSVLGASTLPAMFPAILFNAIILIYGMSPRIRESFGMP